MHMSPGATGPIRARGGTGRHIGLRNRRRKALGVQLSLSAPVFGKWWNWNTCEFQKLVPAMACGFKPRLADQINSTQQHRTVAQSVDAPDLNPESAARRCRFDSGLSDHPTAPGVPNALLKRFAGFRLPPLRPSTAGARRPDPALFAGPHRPPFFIEI